KPPSSSKCLWQMLVRDVVDRGHYTARRPRWCRELHVQDVDGAAAQFERQSQRDTYERSMRTDPSNRDVVPTSRKSIDAPRFCHVKRVLVRVVGLGESLDQARRIGLVPGKTGPDRMCIDRYSHSSPVLIPIFSSSERKPLTNAVLENLAAFRFISS